MLKTPFLVFAMLVGCTGGAGDDLDVTDPCDLGDCEGDEGEGGEGVPTALLEWSDCMDLDDWTRAGVAQAWSDVQTDTSETCVDCHGLGGDGFIASDDAALVFDSIRDIPELLVPYFTLDASENVIANRALMEAVGAQEPPHQQHPAFGTYAFGAQYEALARFYDMTTARVLAGECPPSR